MLTHKELKAKILRNPAVRKEYERLKKMSLAGRLLTVCYTLRDEETVRLISARKATKNEVKYYAQGI